MIIVRFQGGLGNQLFQYALYRELQFHGIEVKADLTAYDKQGNIRRFSMEQAFGVPIEIASKKEIFRISGGDSNFFEKVVRKYIKGKNVYKEAQITDVKDLLNIKNGYINGYWQSERWFENVGSMLKKELVFQNVNDSFTQKCIRASREQSVSIHVRMGDYVNLDELYGGICTEDYYAKAITYIREHVSNPVFYVVSDEPDKARKLIGEIVDAEYLENDHPDYWDMMFMSSCRHNILANSSFSWWSAYLNGHEDKIAVAPSKWNNFEDTRNVYVEQWVKI